MEELGRDHQTFQLKCQVSAQQSRFFSGQPKNKHLEKSNTSFVADFYAESNADNCFSKFDCLFVTLAVILVINNFNKWYIQAVNAIWKRVLFWKG